MNYHIEPDKKRPRRNEAKGSGKGQGRSKNKAAGKGGKGQAGKLPAALAGGWKTVKGQRPCHWFNQGLCKSEAAPGEKCNQGLHLCMGPGCGEPHPFVECPKQKKNRK